MRAYFTIAALALSILALGNSAVIGHLTTLLGGSCM